MNCDNPITSEEPSGQIRACARRRTGVVEHEFQNQDFHNVYINQSFAAADGLVGHFVRSAGRNSVRRETVAAYLTQIRLSIDEVQAQEWGSRLPRCSSTCSAASRQAQQHIKLF